MNVKIGYSNEVRIEVVENYEDDDEGEIVKLKVNAGDLSEEGLKYKLIM